MKVDRHLIQELTTLISQRGIDLLTLTTPDVSIELERGDQNRKLSNRSGRSQQEATDQSEPSKATSAKAADYYELIAPSPGIYIDRHPLSEHPLVHSGGAVTIGQLIGFLKVGCLLLPLRTAQSGRIVCLPPRPGDTLGYGSVVMRLAAGGRT